MLEVEALRDAAQLDVKVLLEQLEGHFFARVGQRVIDFAEASAMDGPLDGVAVERLGFRLKGEFHRLSAVSRRLGRIVRKGQSFDRHGSHQSRGSGERRAASDVESEQVGTRSVSSELASRSLSPRTLLQLP